MWDHVPYCGATLHVDDRIFIDVRLRAVKYQSVQNFRQNKVY